MPKLDRETLDAMATRKPVGGPEVESYKRAVAQLLGENDDLRAKLDAAGEEIETIAATEVAEPDVPVEAVQAPAKESAKRDPGRPRREPRRGE